MLIREVIKHTPEDNDDLKALEDAYGKIQDLASEINESKRRMEQQVELTRTKKREKKKKKKKKKKSPILQLISLLPSPSPDRFHQSPKSIRVNM